MKKDTFVQLHTDYEKSDYQTLYPRPQMRRASFCPLNGCWQCNGHRILVPYPPESAASEYEGPLQGTFDYKRDFTLPEGFLPAGYRLILHFGAVDQICEVFIDGTPVGQHRGGYLSFSFDITDALAKQPNHSLSVTVTDTLDHTYPYGKQRKDRGGMWYTPVSGIWQSVWLEALPQNHITDITAIPNASDSITLSAYTTEKDALLRLEVFEPLLGDRLDAFWEAPDASPIFACDFEGYRTLTAHDFGPFFKPWSPEAPYLYPFRLTFGKDSVLSYFGLRKIGLKTVKRYQVPHLNDRPTFFCGLLDQGYFPEGLFTPNSPRAYRDDILNMQALGYNLLRKHIKVEPEIFYYEADKAGMLILQDMVNNGNYYYWHDTIWPTLFPNRKPDDTDWCQEEGGRCKVFEQHSLGILSQLKNHPCIIGYTVFNEGWGQYDSDRVGDLLREADPSRLYDYTSGWFAREHSDFDSIHRYFDFKPPVAKEKALFISECGGFSEAIQGHVFHPSKEYGYGKVKDAEGLTDKMIQMYEKMILPAVKTGLIGIIYTQVSDIEDEVNGLYTYDRAVCKVQADRIKAINKRLFETFFEFFGGKE